MVFGIISDGRLAIVPDGYPDAKPVVYEDVPLFDQEAQYAIQQAPVDLGDHIFMGVEVRDMVAEDYPPEEPQE